MIIKLTINFAQKFTNYTFQLIGATNQL